MNTSLGLKNKLTIKINIVHLPFISRIMHANYTYSCISVIEINVTVKYHGFFTKQKI